MFADCITSSLPHADDTEVSPSPRTIHLSHLLSGEGVFRDCPSRSLPFILSHRPLTRATSSAPFPASRRRLQSPRGYHALAAAAGETAARAPAAPALRAQRVAGTVIVGIAIGIAVGIAVGIASGIAIGVGSVIGSVIGFGSTVVAVGWSDCWSDCWPDCWSDNHGRQTGIVFSATVAAGDSCSAVAFVDSAVISFYQATTYFHQSISTSQQTISTSHSTIIHSRRHSTTTPSLSR